MNITSQQVEERLIGCIIYEGNKSALKAATFLDETEFSDPACSILYGVCLSLVGQHKTISGLSIDVFIKENATELQCHFKRLTNLNGMPSPIASLTIRAMELEQMHATRNYSFDLATSCMYLKDEHLRRKIQEKLTTLHDRLNNGEDVLDALENATHELLTLSAHSFNLKTYKTLDDAFDEAIKETKDEVDGKIVRLPTGFSELDIIIYGLEKGRLYCIAAEEKIGKSLLSYQIGLQIAKAGRPVAIVSLEMRASEIAKRFAGVNSGQDAKSRLKALEQFKKEIGEMPLYLRDGSASQSKLFTIAHKLYAEKHIELLIVDYLQLIELKGKDRVNEINDFVSRLKGLAMDLQIPVVLIAAVLNKQINNRYDGKPKPADIRDTGRLANDADCIMFLWKPDEQDDTYIELNVARSRYSLLGDIGLQLDKETLRLNPTQKRERENYSSNNRF